ARSSILRSARALRRGAVRLPASPSRPLWRATAMPGSWRACGCGFTSVGGASCCLGAAARTTIGRGRMNSASPEARAGGTAAHQQFRAAQHPALFLEEELQRARGGHGPAVDVAAQDDRSFDALQERVAARFAARGQPLAGEELPDADAGRSPEQLGLGALAAH